MAADLHTTPCTPCAALLLLRPRLEVVSEPAGLTGVILEVLPVCSPSIQRQLIGILPEVAQAQDHGVVLEQLQKLLEADVTFMAAVVECLGNMMLEPAVQVCTNHPLVCQEQLADVEQLHHACRQARAALPTL